jgi:hypothetical protein
MAYGAQWHVVSGPGDDQIARAEMYRHGPAQAALFNEWTLKYLVVPA